MGDVFEYLKNLIIIFSDVKRDDITLESTFQDDLKFDSLDVVELLIEVEEDFEIEIDNSELNDYELATATVGTAVAMINRHIAKE